MEEIECQLKELILDEDFTNLQNLASEEVNLMEILGVAHRELQHSNFLAWLFNPNESHNLGDFAIKEFIKLYYRENQFEDLGLQTKLSVFDFVHLDFDDLEIKREHKNIDLILLSKRNEFCIVIENKIYSTEGKGQLKKYRNWIESEFPTLKYKIYIFLSLFEQEISEEEQDYYLRLDYTHIVKLIEQIVQTRNLADESKFVFEQYLKTLKSMLNQNEEIELIAQNLYKKYQSAFDLVFKYNNKISQSPLKQENSLLEKIKKEPSLRFIKGKNSYIYFHPIFLYDLLPKLKQFGVVSQEDDLKNNFIFLYEFNVRDNFIDFDLKIGEGNQNYREILYSFYLKHRDFFQKVDSREKFSAKYHTVYKKNIVTKSEFEKFLGDENFDINELINERFRELIDVDFPKIEKMFREELK
ncbi:MAG: PD-(D/E)XK nuclease family protein, partial [Acidobacteriota bacterium]|nr:PD-(D/E)XK nuclease family protein [Acidobacteriota bacterium]